MLSHEAKVDYEHSMYSKKAREERENLMLIVNAFQRKFGFELMGKVRRRWMEINGKAN